jgi:hypothetical protein
MKYDEISVLHTLDRLLNNSEVKIVYRPHPWSKNPPEIFEENFNNLVIDPQIRRHYYSSGRSSSKVTSFQPDLSYYESLIWHSLFVIGGPSTLMLESFVCRKHYLGICMSESSKKGINDTQEMYDYFEHTKGVDALNSFYKISSLEALSSIVPNYLDKNTCAPVYDQASVYYTGFVPHLSYCIRVATSLED